MSMLKLEAWQRVYRARVALERIVQPRRPNSQPFTTCWTYFIILPDGQTQLKPYSLVTSVQV